MGIASLGLLVLGAFGVTASIARLSRVSRAVSLDPEQLAAFIKRNDRPARARALASAIRELDVESSLGSLADGLAENDTKLQAAMCNEAIHDVSADLDWGAGAPPAALRLCVFGTLLAAAAVVLLRRPGLGGDLLDVVGLGGGASLLVIFARRESDAIVKRARLGVDAWVTASTGSRGEGPKNASR